MGTPAWDAQDMETPAWGAQDLAAAWALCQAVQPARAAGDRRGPQRQGGPHGEVLAQPKP